MYTGHKSIFFGEKTAFLTKLICCCNSLRGHWEENVNSVRIPSVVSTYICGLT